MDIKNYYPNIIMNDILKKYIDDTKKEYSNFFLYNENIKKNTNNIQEDAWEMSINDNNFYVNNKIARIFPVLKNFNNLTKIKIDDESFSYITIREIADLISKIICFHLLEYNLNPLKIKIVDYTSGVGGNVLSFCRYFKYVYAVELSTLRAEYLKNNIDIYGFQNIEVINRCGIEFNNNDLINKNPNIIFIDPPWGGCNYKNNENLQLKLGNCEIEEIVIDICNKFSNYYKNKLFENPDELFNNYNTKFIVLKLPKNYDIEYFYNYIKKYNTFDNYFIKCNLYILNKMLIIICKLIYSL